MYMMYMKCIKYNIILKLNDGVGVIAIAHITIFFSSPKATTFYIDCIFNTF